MKGSVWWANEVPEDLGEGYLEAIVKAIRGGHAHIQWAKLTIADLEVKTFGAPLAIGSPEDYVYLFGLSAFACDRIAEVLGEMGCPVMTPTSLLLDALAALPDAEFIGPHTQPNGAAGMTKAAAKAHNDAVQEAEKLHDPGTILLGYCKTYTLNPRYRKGYACEYWWPVSEGYARANASWLPGGGVNSSRTGYVVQPEQWAHFYLHFWDYSMGAYYIAIPGKLAGLPVSLAQMAQDPSLSARISLWGPLPWVVHPEYRPLSGASQEPSGRVSHPVLRRGDKGAPVVEWQTVLVTAGESLSPYGADGDFGRLTEEATRRYQRARGLFPDGIVGPKTWATAGAVEEPSEPERVRPPFKPLYGQAAREAAWGRFEYVSEPVPGNPEAIRITDDWVRQSIMAVDVPQLRGIAGAPRNGRAYLHKRIAPQFLALWKDWEDANLLHLVKSWAGMWVPRFIRGSRSVLSNHAFGTAFDINAPWNPLGAEPPRVGETGSVRQLVPYAWDRGFYWGGDFPNRPDGMHFEATEVAE